MTVERTLSIIKPDAVGNNHIGDIVSAFEKAGLKIVACKMLHLSKQQAEEFYAVHKGRPFFTPLVDFMITGPVMVMVLEGNNAIAENRRIMGETNPVQAKEKSPHSIRAKFANTIDENAVHGSDSPETAQTEIAFFFKNGEICPRTR